MLVSLHGGEAPPLPPQYVSGKCAQSPYGHPNDRLSHDVLTHFGDPEAALHERDRHFGDAEARAMRMPDHVDLEAVALAYDTAQVDGLERLPPELTIAARDVVIAVRRGAAECPASVVPIFNSGGGGDRRGWRRPGRLPHREFVACHGRSHTRDGAFRARRAHLHSSSGRDVAPSLPIVLERCRRSRMGSGVRVCRSLVGAVPVRRRRCGPDRRRDRHCVAHTCCHRGPTRS